MVKRCQIVLSVSRYLAFFNGSIIAGNVGLRFVTTVRSILWKYQNMLTIKELGFAEIAWKSCIRSKSSLNRLPTSHRHLWHNQPPSSNQWYTRKTLSNRMTFMGPSWTQWAAMTWAKASISLTLIQRMIQSIMQLSRLIKKGFHPSSTNTFLLCCQLVLSKEKMKIALNSEPDNQVK